MLQHAPVMISPFLPLAAHGNWSWYSAVTYLMKECFEVVEKSYVDRLAYVLYFTLLMMWNLNEQVCDDVKFVFNYRLRVHEWGHWEAPFRGGVPSHP